MTSSKSNYKILIVDSSPIVVNRLDRLLREVNCYNCVSTALSYNDALTKLSEDQFDAVLLDTHLHERNGFELLSYIKTNYPKTRTIMLTNQTDPLYRDKGESMGADHFIDKSGDFEKVIGILNEYSLEYQAH